MLEKEQIKYKIKHFLPYIFGFYKKSGFLPTPFDHRDFKLGALFGWKEYTPKHDSWELKEISTKDQNNFNICVFSSLIGAKEIDEGIELSTRDIVNYAYRKGYISGNGYSDLRSGQKALQDYGTRSLADFPDGNFIAKNDWNGFINGTLDYPKAEIYKSKTFWSLGTKGEILEQLDNGRPVHCAIPWYSGYNQSGGFKDPWLITMPLGYSVGGHAIYAKGYLMNYRGKKVIKIKNSYSAKWGDNGCFYIELDFFVKQISLPGYGAYVNLDLSVDTGAFLDKFSSRNVKKKNNSTIYLIQDGKKRVYPNWQTYLAWDGNVKGYSLLSDQDALLLDKISEGEPMDIKKSVYWTVIEELKLADDKDGNLINSLLQLQYNRYLGMPLKTNLE